MFCADLRQVRGNDFHRLRQWPLSAPVEAVANGAVAEVEFVTAPHFGFCRYARHLRRR
jgi:hypothetical protein